MFNPVDKFSDHKDVLGLRSVMDTFIDMLKDPKFVKPLADQSNDNMPIDANENFDLMSKLSQAVDAHQSVNIQLNFNEDLFVTLEFSEQVRKMLSENAILEDNDSRYHYLSLLLVEKAKQSGLDGVIVSSKSMAKKYVPELRKTPDAYVVLRDAIVDSDLNSGVPERNPNLNLKSIIRFGRRAKILYVAVICDSNNVENTRLLITAGSRKTNRIRFFNDMLPIMIGANQSNMNRMLNELFRKHGSTTIDEKVPEAVEEIQPDEPAKSVEDSKDVKPKGNKPKLGEKYSAKKDPK